MLGSAFREARWINEKRVVAYPLILLFVLILVATLWVSNAPVIPPHPNVEFSQDFVNVYAAGQAVREGDPSEPYDWHKHKEREHELESFRDGSATNKSHVPWLYPPMFLGIAGLLAFLPYYGALAAYLVAGFAAYVAVIRKLAPFSRAGPAIVAFPGVCVNLFAGQNGFLTTALLGGGLLYLERRPIFAGFLFGLLSYKPQFFILIPVVLLVSRSWKALVSSIATALAFAATSVAAFGMDPWLGFVKGLPLARSTILEYSGDRWFGIMHTPFSAMRMLGGSLSAAYATQTVFAILSVALVIYIWSRKSSLAVRGSALVAAMLLSSPYSFNYDQVVLAIPIALLAVEGIRTGFLPYEKVFLFLLWLLPAFAKDYGENYAFPLTPPMLVGLLTFCCLRLNTSPAPQVSAAPADQRT